MDDHVDPAERRRPASKASAMAVSSATSPATASALPPSAPMRDDLVGRPCCLRSGRRRPCRRREPVGDGAADAPEAPVTSATLAVPVAMVDMVLPPG
ncbi:hypothetical protein GXW82_40650 [Streptacidiphilus sp. 4-A2]|nr:hypothetical protein [Streptacidiphilus sp. 4-A2]